MVCLFRYGHDYVAGALHENCSHCYPKHVSLLSISLTTCSVPLLPPSFLPSSIPLPFLPLPPSSLPPPFLPPPPSPSLLPLPRCSETMLAFFPVAARQFCSPPNLAQYKVAVMNKMEEEYKKFKGMAHSAGTATSRYGTQCRYSHIKVWHTVQVQPHQGDDVPMDGPYAKYYTPLILLISPSRLILPSCPVLPLIVLHPSFVLHSCRHSE